MRLHLIVMHRSPRLGVSSDRYLLVRSHLWPSWYHGCKRILDRAVVSCVCRPLASPGIGYGRVYVRMCVGRPRRVGWLLRYNAPGVGGCLES